MAHAIADAVVAAVKGYCEIHGVDSRECGAAREAGNIVIGGLALAGILGGLWGLFSQR